MNNIDRWMLKKLGGGDKKQASVRKGGLGAFLPAE
jgi:hypothetical protein